MEINMDKNQTYKSNLKLHQESKRKILDIILSSSMPHQLQNIKTILWVNLLFIGLSVQIFKEISFSWYQLLFYVPVVVSVALLLVAMLSKRYKWYGGYDDIDYAYDIYDNENADTKMIATLLKNDDIAIKENKKIMRYLARLMHLALWSTFAAFVAFLIIIALNQNYKGGNELMADDKSKIEKPSEQPVNTTPSNESVERSAKKTSQK
jgi:hypothetical protein